MRAPSTWLRLSLLCSALLLLSACAGSPTPADPTGGSVARVAPDDNGLHQMILAGQGGGEVTFDGTVLAEPAQVGSHEHLTVSVPTGETLEIDHNTSLATVVPAHAGDRVIVHGQLYIDPGRAGVHCTHRHTSRGCPQPGWIELSNTYYE